MNKVKQQQTMRNALIGMFALVVLALAAVFGASGVTAKAEGQPTPYTGDMVGCQYFNGTTFEALTVFLQ